MICWRENKTKLTITKSKWENLSTALQTNTNWKQAEKCKTTNQQSRDWKETTRSWSEEFANWSLCKGKWTNTKIKQPSPLNKFKDWLNKSDREKATWITWEDKSESKRLPLFKSLKWTQAENWVATKMRLMTWTDKTKNSRESTQKLKTRLHFWAKKLKGWPTISENSNPEPLSTNRKFKDYKNTQNKLKSTLTESSKSKLIKKSQTTKTYFATTNEKLKNLEEESLSFKTVTGNLWNTKINLRWLARKSKGLQTFLNKSRNRPFTLTPITEILSENSRIWAENIMSCRSHSGTSSKLKPLERSANWSKILPTSNGKMMSWKESSKSMNQEPKSNLLSLKPSL